jgi:hypothetical protein
MYMDAATPDALASAAKLAFRGGLVDNKQQQPDPVNRLVVVLETNDQIQLAMARGLLEGSGIPLFIQGQLATLYQSLDGFLHKWIRLEVPEDRAAEAKEILEPVLKPRPFLC